MLRNRLSGRKREPQVEYQPFWWSAEWRPVIPDTVLSHLRFRVDGQRPYRVVKATPTPADGWEDDDVLLALRVEGIVQSEGQAWAAWLETDRESGPGRTDANRSRAASGDPA